MTIILDRRETQTEEKANDRAESSNELILTPFGKLTEAEIRQWEELLGQPLRRG